MTVRPRLVLDTNVLISRLLLPASVPGQAVSRAVGEGQLLVSDATLDELATVLARPKFDPYVSVEDRQEFIRQLGRVAERIPIVYAVHVCRDPQDNAVLATGINGRADLIVTGDSDLLALGLYQGIAILTPAQYLAS